MLNQTYFVAFSILSPLVTTTSPIADHGVCTEKLYEGLLKFLYTAEKIEKVIEEDDSVKFDEALTCELVYAIGELIFENFDGAGCSWGYNNGVFYERNLKYLGEFLTGECSLLSGEVNDRSDPDIASAYESVTCGVEEEIIASVEKLAQCVQMKIFPLMMSSKPYEPGKDLCFDAETFTPCLEGLVDSCHNDYGEASAALLDFYAAYVAVMIKQVGMQMAPTETKSYMDQLASCSDDQLGALTRFGSINFDFEVTDDMLPSAKVLAEKMTTGHKLVFSDERMQQFTKRMEGVFKRSGLNRLLIKK